MHTLPKSVNDVLRHMETVYTVLRKKGITFSKTEAMKIVGSRATLERLKETGMIRVSIRNESYRKGQWECNAEDVLRYAADE